MNGTEGEQPARRTENVQTMPLERIVDVGLRTESIDTLQVLRQELLRRSANRMDGDLSMSGIDPAITEAYTVVERLLDEKRQVAS